MGRVMALLSMGWIWRELDLELDFDMELGIEVGVSTYCREFLKGLPK